MDHHVLLRLDASCRPGEDGPIKTGLELSISQPSLPRDRDLMRLRRTTDLWRAVVLSSDAAYFLPQDGVLEVEAALAMITMAALSRCQWSSPRRGEGPARLPQSSGLRRPWMRRHVSVWRAPRLPVPKVEEELVDDDCGVKAQQHATTLLEKRPSAAVSMHTDRHRVLCTKGWTAPMPRRCVDAPSGDVLASAQPGAYWDPSHQLLGPSVVTGSRCGAAVGAST